MNTNPKAKRILCLGDSLTWGYIPDTKYERFPANVRWPGKLQALLGDSFEVIEEGLNSRSIESEDMRPGKGGRSAKSYINSCLYTHDPLDYIFILLGTNELKFAFNNSPEDIGHLMASFLGNVCEWKPQFEAVKPQVVLISPPALNENTPYALEGDKYKGAHDKSLELEQVYGSLAADKGVGFVSFSDLPVGKDGVHLEAEEHATAALRVASYIREQNDRRN
jgi:lysophospholipase L1-like esterase